MLFLTKSKFVDGTECPFKLTSDYQGEAEENSFLSSLADGGFQAEELCRLYYPGGILIEELDYKISLEKTKREFKKRDTILYEAAFNFKNLFVRTDILVKSKNEIKIIEVKAKSFNSEEDEVFLSKKGKIRSNWKPYLYDLAFQTYVLKNKFPDFKISACFMLADKSKKASVDGLNQLFQISNINNRTGVKVNVKSLEDIGDPIMEEVDVTSLINEIIYKDIHLIYDFNFLQIVEKFSKIFKSNNNLNWDDFGDHVCESCWKSQYRISETDEDRPNVFELWNYRSKHKSILSHRFFLDQLDRNEFLKKSENYLTVQNRQLLQIEKRVQQSNNKSVDFYLDKENLRKEIKNWNFPFHFIDFETCTSALPFTKGTSPYEQIAFQFSHHAIDSVGKIEHKSEYINVNPGEFPNFLFVRALKKVLSFDNGSVFMYAKHENSILNAIRNQLKESDEKDKQELIQFIESITTRTEENNLIEGERKMIDLCDIVKKYFYHPDLKGSNSIKAVLPTVIKISDYIKQKYSKPISQIKLSSKNFNEDHIWIKNEIYDPYESLPKPDFSNIKNPIGMIEKLNNGGEALMAYAKIQYFNMSNDERDILKDSLLKYCELDTLAMVIIYEFFSHNLK